MWLIVFPAAALWFAVFGVRKILNAPRTDEPQIVQSTEEQAEHQIDIIVGTSDVDLEEAGVPIISDILKWIEDASIRLEITEKTEIMRVGAIKSDRSTFIRFTSKGINLNLWIDGPEYMAPFPRLCVAEGDSTGIVIERTAVDFEKAVNAIRT